MEELQLEEVTEYLRTKDRLYVNPRYKFNMRGVIMELSNQNIDMIRQQFQMHEDGINLQKFLWLLQQAIPCEEAERGMLCYELTRLFEEVDVDGSNTMEWSQFLEYLSQSSWLAREQEDDKSEKEVVYYAFREEAKYRKHSIRQVVEIQKHSLLAIITNDNQLSFINYEKEGHKSGFTLNHTDPSKVLAIDYSEPDRLFAVLLTNRNLCFVEDAEIQKLAGVVRSTGSEVSVKYLPIHAMWCLQSSNFQLQLFKSPKYSNIEEKIVFKPHQHPVSAIEQISSPTVLATGSLDGSVKLWNISNRRLVAELRADRECPSQHKGVRGIATFNRGKTSIICSWTFSTSIYVWLPSLSLSKPFLGELHGHTGLIDACRFTSSGQFVSVDTRRILKVWNPERFECLQTIQIPEESCRFFMMKSRPYLLVYNRILDFYRVRTNSKADLQAQIGLSRHGDRNVLSVSSGQVCKLISVDFSSYYSCLVVGTSHQLRVLDVNNAALVASVLPPGTEEFVSVAMRSQRRAYIGLTGGSVCQHSIQDGHLAHKIQVAGQNDEKDIRFVFFLQETKMLLVVVEHDSCSQIITYDEVVCDGTPIKEIEFKQVNLQDFKASQEFNRMYILSDQVLTIWDIDKMMIIDRYDLYTQWNRIAMTPDGFSVLLEGSQSVLAIRLYNSGEVAMSQQIHFDSDHVSSIAAVALMNNTIPIKITEQETEEPKKSQKKFTVRSRKNQMKSTQYHLFDEAAPIKNKTTRYQEREQTIMAVSNTSDETYYYNISQFLSEDKKEPYKNYNSKLQRAKEKRCAHLKNPNSVPFYEVSCEDNLIKNDYAFTPRASHSGSILSRFYFFTADRNFILTSPTGQPQGEWNLGLNKPKEWRLNFNELQQILTRIGRTAEALKWNYLVDSKQLTLKFLVAKYLSQEDIDNLTTKKGGKVMKQESTPKVFKPTKSVKIIIEPRQAVVKKEQAIKPKPPRKAKGNMFLRKTEEENTQNIYKGSEDLLTKVKRSLTFTRAFTAQPIQPSPLDPPEPIVANNLVSHIENYFTPHRHSTQSIDAESIRKGRRITSQSSQKQGMQRCQSSYGSQLAAKERVKVSMAQISRNFSRTKVELASFTQMKKNTRGTVEKKGRRLQL